MFKYTDITFILIKVISVFFFDEKKYLLHGGFWNFNKNSISLKVTK